MQSTFAIDAPAETRWIADESLRSQLSDGPAERPRPINFGVRGVTATIGAVAAAAVTVFSSPTMVTHVTSAVAEAFSPRLWSIALPDAMQTAVGEMETYRGLRAGWDGRGSIAPDDSTISAAEWFLGLLPRGTVAPEAIASADGDAGWYWKTAQTTISVVFERSGRMIYFGQRAGVPVARGAYTFCGTTAIPTDLLEAIRAA